MNESAVRRLPKPEPSVVFCEVEEGAVLLSTSEETYYGLNSVGARVWQLLSRHETYESLCIELSASYPGVELQLLYADVSTLIVDLLGNGLVS